MVNVTSRRLTLFGLILLGIGTVLLASVYGPLTLARLNFILFPVKAEVKVVAVLPKENLPNDKKYIQAVSTEFGVVIPKIHANAPVVPSVNPYQESVYQEALTRGVAHAAGTALPDQPGAVFLFAHSAGDITRAMRYNAVFYLLSELTTGDDIYLFYKGQPYRYQVEKTEIVAPDKVEYLNQTSPERTLILMTCTPAGTSRDRLLVHAKLVAVNP
jgi:LPXTG-site transpeptidase (sortase) family protein